MAYIRNRSTAAVIFTSARESLVGEDLSGRDLRNADLRNYDLSSANLERADLRGADLSGVTVSQRTRYAGALLDRDGREAIESAMVEVSYRYQGQPIPKTLWEEKEEAKRTA